jgi:hypothetical protein
MPITGLPGLIGLGVAPAGVPLGLVLDVVTTGASVSPVFGRRPELPVEASR